MTTRPYNPATAPAQRRGLTLLETVAAVVLLSLLAAGVMGALSNVVHQQVRQQRRLQAVELANRLMLQYLDDPKLMPPRTLPVAYGKERYRWDIAEAPTRLVNALEGVASERQGRSALLTDRIKAVTLHVWLSEESGGTIAFDERYPTATLTRLVDPVAALYRNPDTLNAILADDARKRELLAQFVGTGEGGLVNRPTTPTGSGAAGNSGQVKAGSNSAGKPSTSKPSTTRSPSSPKRNTQPGSGRGNTTDKGTGGK